MLGGSQHEDEVPKEGAAAIQSSDAKNTEMCGKKPWWAFYGPTSAAAHKKQFKQIDSPPTRFISIDPSF